LTTPGELTPVVANINLAASALFNPHGKLCWCVQW